MRVRSRREDEDEEGFGGSSDVESLGDWENGDKGIWK